MKIVTVTRKQMEEMKKKGFEEALNELADMSEEVENEDFEKTHAEKLIEELGINEVLSLRITMNGEGFNITCGGSSVMRNYLSDKFPGSDDLIKECGFKLGDAAQEFVRKLMIFMDDHCEEINKEDEEK